MRRFVGIDLGREPVPDETTICRFRHLLESHDFGRRMFEFIHEHLEAKGLRLSSGTIVDATVIHAPSSTKNEEKARDPDMHQTKKGNQWYSWPRIDPDQGTGNGTAYPPRAWTHFPF